MWSFRVVKTTLPEGGIRYALHEVIYAPLLDEVGGDLTISELEKLGMSWTEDPVGPEFYFRPGEAEDADLAVRTLRQELMDMFKSTTWPIVNGDRESGMPLIQAVSLRDDE